LQRTLKGPKIISKSKLIFNGKLGITQNVETYFVETNTDERKKSIFNEVIKVVYIEK